jgi:hypothetical protein
MTLLLMLWAGAVCGVAGFSLGMRWAEAKQDGIGDADDYKVGGTD